MGKLDSLDRVFSEWIRRRDSDPHTGLGRCISCKKIVHWKEADAGHFVNRKHLSLRYDEKNVNLQCRSCNRFDEGNVIGYNHGIIEKYGDGVIEYLRVKKHNSCKLGKFETDLLKKIYKAKIKELE